MDPVTLAVVRGALEQIADEMDLHLIRAALSPIISETNDCAHGLYEPTTGETIAQGGYGLPMFLANMQFTVQRLIPIAEAAGGFRPGDIWITNDPYLSGTHLNDVVLVSPHFVDGRLFALFANTGHWMDMGGSVPGGWAPTAREIHQEGIIIPPLRLFEEGRRNEAVVGLITANVRLPQQLLGDLEAMTNVFSLGRRGLDALVARYGADVLKSCMDEMMRRSEAEMRSYIAEIPDGTYRITDYFDNDGVVDEPLTVALAITVDGSDLTFDFTGTSAKAVGPMNISDATTRSLCLVALKHIFPEAPVSGGAFRPARFVIPKPSILAAEYPSAVGGTTDVTQRIVDVVFGALAQAIPQHTPAAPFGTTGVATVSGRHPATGKYFVAVYPYPGGYGASQASDGLLNGTPPGSMAKFMSVEMSEHRYPVRFRSYGVREGSGGAGMHRGGCGSHYEIETLSDAVVSILGDRVDHAPFGVQGGGPAAPNSVELKTGGETWIPPMRSKAEKVPFTAGDSFHLGSPGGGGFGDPLDRDLSAVEADLNGGFIDAAAAESVYGAVVATKRMIGDRPVYTLDPERSRARRGGLRPDQRRAGVERHENKKTQREDTMTLTRRQLGALAAGAAFAASSRASFAQSAPIKIGAVNPYSGAMAQYGDEVTRCYELAAEWINGQGGLLGRQVQIVRGNATSAQEGIGAVEQLVGRDKVDILAGTYVTAISNAASESALNYGKLYWETNALARDLTDRGLPNFVRTGPSSNEFASRAVEGAIKVVGGKLNKQAKDLKVWIEHEDSAYGTSIAMEQQRLFKAAGVTVGLGSHSAKAIDVTDSILRAKNFAPDVWISTAYVVDTNLLLRAARDQGFKPAAMMSCGVGDTKETLEAIGKDYLDGILLVSYPRPDVSEKYGPGAGAFLKLYRDKLGRDPVAPQGMNAFVGMKILFEAIKAAGSVEFEKVIKAAAAMDKPLGAYETGYGVKFDDKMQNARALPVVAQWQGGAVKAVFPAEAASEGVSVINVPRA